MDNNYPGVNGGGMICSLCSRDVHLLKGRNVTDNWKDVLTWAVSIYKAKQLD